MKREREREKVVNNKNGRVHKKQVALGGHTASPTISNALPLSLIFIYKGPHDADFLN